MVEEKARDPIKEDPGGHEQAGEQVGPAHELQHGVIANPARGTTSPRGSVGRRLGGMASAVVRQGSSSILGDLRRGGAIDPFNTNRRR